MVWRITKLREHAYGFTKIRSLFCWLGPVMDHVKQAHRARFMEIDHLHPIPPIVKQLLSLDPDSTTRALTCPEITIDLGDHAHFDMEPLLVTVQLTPIGMPLDIQMDFYYAYHLPYLVQALPDGMLTN
jgi:hypothetical protein